MTLRSFFFSLYVFSCFCILEVICSCCWQVPAQLLFCSCQCHSGNYSNLALNKLLAYGHLCVAVLPVVQRVVNNQG